MDNAFHDPAVAPTPELIAAQLGQTLTVWQKWKDALAKAGVTAQWRYYRDGGWLVKAVRGNTTMCWCSIGDGVARTTFYFVERHRAILAESPALPEVLRAQITQAHLMARSLPATVALRIPADVDTAAVLLEYKQSLK